MSAEYYQTQQGDNAPKSTKILGFIDVRDPDIAAIIQPLEKQFTGWAFPFVRTKLHGENGQRFQGELGKYLIQFAEKTPLKGKPELLAKSVDLLFLKAGPMYDIGSRIWGTANEYVAANRAFAKEIAPVFHADHKGDNMRGVLSSTNEVIGVQRKKIYHDWMGKVYGGMAALPSTGFEWLMANVPAHVNENSSKGMARLSGMVNKVRNDDLFRQGAAGVVERVGHLIHRKARKAEERREQAHTAYGMIKFLAENVEQEPGQERVPAMNDHGRIPLKRYIKDVFQCHQRNMGEKELGQRTLEKLDYACEKIAEEIQNGQLNPLALVALVGERGIVRPGGKQIAPRKEIDEAIAKQKARLPVHYAVDAEQYIEESILNKEDVKHLLETLKGENRDFFMVCLPQEVVEQAGVTAKDYTEAKQRTHESFARFLHEAVMDMSTLTDKQLRDVGFKDEQIDTLRDVAAEVKGKPVRSVLASVSTHGEFAKGIEFIVAGNVDYWRSLANSEFKTGDLFKKVKEEKKAAAKPGMTGEEEAPARTEEDEERHERRASHRRRATRARRDDMEENDLSADGEEFDQERSARPGLRGLAEHAHLGRLAAERDQGREWAS